MSSPYATINGRIMNYGRTYRRQDGTYESYDLKDANPGDTLLITTLGDRGQEQIHELTKQETPEGEAAVSNWVIAGKIGLATLVLLDRMKGGGPMRTHGIVLREGRTELGAVWPDSKDSNVVHNLGQVASMASVRLTEDFVGPHKLATDAIL